MGGHANCEEDPKGAWRISRVSDEVPTPRIIIASDMGLRPACALDLTTNDPEDGMPWDFTCKSNRKRAMELLDRDQQLLLPASHVCGAFSSMNNIYYDSMRPNDVHSKLGVAMRHVKFALDLCMKQCSTGRRALRHRKLWSTTLELRRRARGQVRLLAVLGDHGGIKWSSCGLLGLPRTP